MTRNDKIKKGAIEMFNLDGHECWITQGPTGGLNGYVRFEKRPVRESGCDGILNYVPVHGGITYADEDENGMVYGFDTAHCNSDQYPLHDPSWIKDQIKVMLDGIKKASEVEETYLLATSNEEKAKLVDAVLSIAPDAELGFGATINLFSGSL